MSIRGYRPVRFKSTGLYFSCRATKLKNNIKDKINEITEIFENYVEKHDVFQETNDSLFSEDKVFKFFSKKIPSELLKKKLPTICPPTLL